MWNVTFFHLGTLAFGSLVLAVVRMIRVILEYVERKVKYFNNDCARFVKFLLQNFRITLFRFLLSCCKCCLWCLERFLRAINHHAYIICAIKVPCYSSTHAILSPSYFPEYQLLLLCQVRLQPVDAEHGEGGGAGQVVNN